MKIWKRGGMLYAYSSESYYKEHPEVSFRAGDEKRKYQIMSVMQTTTSSSVYSFTDVGNWDEYGGYVGKILSGSLYQTHAVYLSELGGTGCQAVGDLCQKTGWNYKRINFISAG